MPTQCLLPQRFNWSDSSGVSEVNPTFALSFDIRSLKIASSSALIVYGEYSFPGNTPSSTSFLNWANPSFIWIPTLAYFLQNLGQNSSWCGWLNMPNKSWNTSTWPDVPPPAPIPMVGISNCSVMAVATLDGMHSRTTAKAPASCNRSASSRRERACSALRPCARNPPRTLIACGVKPTCPKTATDDDIRMQVQIVECIVVRWELSH